MAITPGGNLNITPSSRQATLSTNYLDFTTTDGSGADGWAQQYLPDLMEKEAEVFGKRTVSGFLAQVGAEEAMSSDQVVWSEQGRLHLTFTGTVGTANVSTIQLDFDVDGQDVGTAHGVRLNDLVLLASSAGKTVRGFVSQINSDTGGAQNSGLTDFITVAPYDFEHLDNAGFGDADLITMMVFGSEYAKGKAGQTTANEPSFKSYSNKPVIIKDMYQVSGSDTSAIGWVEVTGEEGQNGYLWYLKAEGDTRARFTDYLEMSMLEAEKTAEASIIGFGADGQIRGAADAGAGGAGTEGLFAAIEDRGNITSGITGVNAATDLAEFDAILAEFDAQGAIEENMMFVNRATSLAMDDMLASMNSYGAGGTSYGVFDNEEDMALNLGFSGFRRGSYDFYKSDMRYLNDKSTRGGINAAAGSAAIRGIIVPAGTSTVYDQSLGKNLKRPFLHVRYRASKTDNRKMKTWTTGSVGATTSALDAMQIHYLSERCLVTQGANNFMLMK